MFNASVPWPEKKKTEKKVTKAFSSPLTVLTLHQWIAVKELELEQKNNKEAEMTTKRAAIAEKKKEKEDAQKAKRRKREPSPESSESSGDDLEMVDGDDDDVDPFAPCSEDESEVDEQTFFDRGWNPEVDDFVLVQFLRK